VPGGEEYGPVKSGETLWGIATRWSEDSGLDVNKVMVAIQRENPQAFMRNNMNLLKRGAILRMPEVSEIQQISTATAFTEVSTQTEEFRQGSSESTVTSAATPLLAEDRQAAEDASADAGGDSTPSEPNLDLSLDAGDEDVADSRDQLELVPPSEASELDSVYGFEENPEGAELTASGSVTSLRENLARTEEELINEQQQNEYLQQQIEELEQRISEQEQAASAKAAELAAMEQRLRTEREQAENKAWYSGVVGWLVAIAIAIAALLGWLFSRRSRADAQAEIDSSEEALRDIQDEAEEVLKVLDEEPPEDESAEDEAAEDIEESPVAEESEEPEVEAEPEAEAEAESPAPIAARPSRHDDEAELLDEESSDPEIQLDLARAYISMGDKEAARVILDEVLAHGNEEQQADAQAMKDQL
jgi:pilus assembly protein FimV